MDENGAAEPGNARPGVVVEFDDEIVEVVAAVEPIAWFIGRPAERTVITAILGGFAPGIVRADPARREQGARAWQAIGPPPQTDGMKTPGGRGAVALTLGCLDPGTAERHPQRLEGLGAGEQPTLRAPARPGADADEA